MLIGEYEAKLTSNKRIAFPKKFRDVLGDNLIVMNGYDGCLVIVDEGRFIALTKDIAERGFNKDSLRDVNRFLIGSAHEVSLDSQGRFVLPQSLLKYSRIKKSGVFLGLLNWVELWDKRLWESRKKYIGESIPELSKDLEKLLGGQVQV